MITDREIFQVAVRAGLNSDQLHILYMALDLPDHEVENAERNANTTDVAIRARKVLLHWRTIRGSTATKQAILEALQECGYGGAIELLLEQWNIQY